MFTSAVKIKSECWEKKAEVAEMVKSRERVVWW